MARLPQPGADAGNWGDILNEYLLQSHTAGGLLKNGTVGTPQLQSASVTNASLADDTIQEVKLNASVRTKLNAVSIIADGAVTTSKLADGSVTQVKLQGAAQANGIATLGSDAKLPDSQLPSRLSQAQMDSAIDASVASALTSSVDIACWGDSMTASSYPGVLAELSGLTVYNGGIGGERSYDIAGRQGGNPMLLTFDGGEIPASGTAFVTPETSDGLQTLTLMKQGTKAMNPATVLGVQGTFNYSTADARYRFIRTTPGSAVTLPAYPVPLIPAARELYSNHVSIFWLGRNNATQVDRIMQDIQASIDSLSPVSPRYLVLSVVNNTSEIIGTAAYNSIVELSRQQASRYGRRFVDVRKLLIKYGLQIAGITPTTTDSQQIANDTTPSSLKSDATHLNAIGNQLVARFVMDRLAEFGWAEPAQGPPPPIEVDEIMLLSDTFDARANGTVLNTTVTDQALGGTSPGTWVTAPSSQFTVTDGIVARGASSVTGVAGIPMSVADYRVDITLTELSTIGLAVRRTAITGGTDHRLSINNTGTATLLVSGGTSFSYVAGDRLGIRVVGTTLQALVNDVVVDEVAGVATLTGAGFASVLVVTNTVYHFTDFSVYVPA